MSHLVFCLVLFVSAWNIMLSISYVKSLQNLVLLVSCCLPETIAVDCSFSRLNCDWKSGNVILSSGAILFPNYCSPQDTITNFPSCGPEWCEASFLGSSLVTSWELGLWLSRKKVGHLVSLGRPHHCTSLLNRWGSYWQCLNYHWFLLQQNL